MLPTTNYSLCFPVPLNVDLSALAALFLFNAFTAVMGCYFAVLVLVLVLDQNGKAKIFGK